MNSTPSDGAAEPSPERTAPDAEVGDRVDAGPASGARPEPGAVPEPRSGLQPLPRRARSVSGGPVVPAPAPGRDPEGRPLPPVDEETLNRLLSGLREI
jgi:hypothetical protein